MVFPHKFSLSPLVLAVAAALLTRTCVGSEPEPIKVGILHSPAGTMAINERPLVESAPPAIDELGRTSGIPGRTVAPIAEDDFLKKVGMISPTVLWDNIRSCFDRTILQEVMSSERVYQLSSYQCRNKGDSQP